MFKQKGLTLQEYIECYNIKKQLKQRSKQKQRQQSQQKSSTHLTLEVVDNSINQSTQNLRQSLNQSIYDKVDSRAKNLNRQLQEKIKQIKIECRGFIKNDKDFSMFVQMMDQLMDKFRFEVMRIHRQNMVLFKVSDNQQTSINQRDQLTRSILQKSFKNQYDESKIEYEQNAKHNHRESSKNKTTQNRQNHHIGSKDLKMTKQNQRQIHKIQNEKTNIKSVKSLPITSTGSILPLKHNKYEEQNMIKDINSMNENGKININTQTVDKSYSYHNLSFGSGFYNNNLNHNNIVKNKPQESQNKKYTPVITNVNNIDKSPKPAKIPKSPSRKYQAENKLTSSASKTPKQKLKSKPKPQKGNSQYQTLRQSQYLTTNKSQQKKLRTTSKSKQKTKKSSNNK